MHVADFNHEDFEQRNQAKQDEGLLVKFFIKPREDAVASKEKGRPIFRDVEWIDIKIPGTRDGVCRPARQKDIDRFPRHYAAFKNRTTDDDVQEGTLLKEWPLISRSQAEELSFFNVKTVEQLIAMPDSQASQFMGMNNLKAKAKEWLELSTEAKEKADLAAQLTKRDDEIAELKAAVKALQAGALKAKPKKKATAKKAKPKVTMIKE
jgi:hypothetical protein